MAEPDERVLLAGALKRYLEELRDTGVEELEYATGAAAAPVSQTQSPAPPSLAESLEDIRNELGDCRRCQLCETRQNIVFGVGSDSAKVLFVGEAPGRDEDLQGEPFVGEAGQLLTKMIKAMGYERSEVYICNVIKCRPPENRNPLPAEIDNCSPFMQRQIKSIAPKAIVALGTFSSQTLLGSKEPISKLRGHFHDYHGIPLMPTFHPAFLLRSPEKKREVWSDLQQVMKLMV
ncbi:MAG: uracil-DNA glycosylase [Geobacteraceae bacterium]|nr:uracil-DNA glycosylase [Geobacteraceae bacterium]